MLTESGDYGPKKDGCEILATKNKIKDIVFVGSVLFKSLPVPS